MSSSSPSRRPLLPDVVNDDVAGGACDEQCEVWVDGGVRRGLGLVTALAPGAC